MRRIPYTSEILFMDDNYDVYKNEQLIHSLKHDGEYLKFKIALKNGRERFEYKTVTWLNDFTELYTNKYVESPEQLFSIEFLDTYKFKNSKYKKAIIPIFPYPFIKMVNGVLYRTISVIPRYAISNTGIIYDTLDEKIIIVNSYTNSYPSVKLPIGTNSYIRAFFLLHRLVAIAWLENDDYLTKPIVNHIDGDKRNCNVSNLEWCSFTDNNRHAVKNGLRKDNLNLDIKNIDTGEILSCSSITEACNIIGRSIFSKKHINIIGTGKIIVGKNGRFEIKNINDDVEWSNHTKLISKNQKSKLIITRDDVTKVFNSTTDVINYLDGIDFKYPSGYLNLDLKRLGEGLLRRGLNVDIVLLNNYSYNNTTYICKNIQNNKIVKLSTRKEIEVLTGSPKSNIQKSIQTNGGYVVSGWIIKRDDGEPFSSLNTILNRPKQIVMTDLTSKDEIKFESLRKAASYLNIDKKSVKNIIRNNNIYRNYKINYQNIH